ncbi:uncharacterized protein VP01_2331g5 [Puccinia sorghi]|uniref:Zinc finger Mcm10/DnaG-type domain-containing protein n=1 Tax=Puccinia sorghi TaxID=27349 RepID=A0A0L6V7F7_9BASI|nr:uncharacterized protein VP01_2331g5 [Puccinia sorghi]
MISSHNAARRTEPHPPIDRKNTIIERPSHQPTHGPKKEPPTKSTLVEGLSDLRKDSKKQNLIQEIKRSTSFSSRPARPIQPPEELRASDLTVNVEIPLGPIAFEPSTIDPEFSEIEPNSHTRLKRRLLSHHVLQDYLSDRYIVRINELYAIIRKAEVSRFQGGTEWKVPLVGDWVLFGVIGQKSDFKTTNPYIASQFNRVIQQKDNADQPQRDDTSKLKNAGEEEEEGVKDDLNDQLQRDDQSHQKGQPNATLEEPKAKQRKFVTFKLIDMSSNKISSSGSGVINMILFEADCEVPSGEEAIQKTYRGGSGGAYEKFWKEQPGTLIAILNPKVLKNRAQSTGYRGPKTEILSITPENQQSIMVIGRSKDLGSCVAKRLDTGNQCGDWCDLRNCGSSGSNALAICDFHLQRQVRKVRAGRAEFFASTSGMSQHTGKSFGESYARKGKKADLFDPTTKTGLLPPTQSKRKSINGHITYICGGTRSSSNDVSRNSRIKSFEERFSRPVDAEKVEGIKLKRRRELEEIQMNKILTDQKEKNDNYGFKCIQDAKLALKRSLAGSGSTASLSQAKKRCLPAEEPPSPSTSGSHKSIYSTAAIRAIGFDPTHHAPGGARSSLVDSHGGDPSDSSAYKDLLQRCPQNPEIKANPYRNPEINKRAKSNRILEEEEENGDGDGNGQGNDDDSKDRADLQPAHSNHALQRDNDDDEEEEEDDLIIDG